MDIMLLIHIAMLILGAILVLTKDFARLGGLVICVGFIPLGYYEYQTSGRLLYVIGGMAMFGIGVYRYLRPRS